MLTFILITILAASGKSLFISGPTTRPGFTRGEGRAEDLSNGKKVVRNDDVWPNKCSVPFLKSHGTGLVFLGNEAKLKRRD